MLENGPEDAKANTAGTLGDIAQNEEDRGSVVAAGAEAGLNVSQQPLRLRLPSVCDISEAMRAYREDGEWRRVEEQRRHRHRQRAAEVAAAAAEAKICGSRRRACSRERRSGSTGSGP